MRCSCRMGPPNPPLRNSAGGSATAASRPWGRSSSRDGRATASAGCCAWSASPAAWPASLRTTPLGRSLTDPSGCLVGCHGLAGVLALVHRLRADHHLPAAVVPRRAAAVAALAPGRLAGRWLPRAALPVGGLRAQALEGPTPLPQNPWAIEGAEGFFRLLDTCISVLLPTVVLLCLASLVVRFRRSTGVQRQQLKWFTYAAPLASAPGPCSPPPGWTSGYRARCGRCSPWSAAGRSRRRSGSRGCATGSMALTGCSTAPWSSGCSPPWPWPPCPARPAPHPGGVDRRFNRHRYDAARTSKRSVSTCAIRSTGHAGGRAAGRGRPDGAADAGVAVAATSAGPAGRPTEVAAPRRGQ
jgi:hypothetical protein